MRTENHAVGDTCRCAWKGVFKLLVWFCYSNCSIRDSIVIVSASPRKIAFCCRHLHPRFCVLPRYRSVRHDSSFNGS